MMRKGGKPPRWVVPDGRVAPSPSSLQRFRGEDGLLRACRSLLLWFTTAMVRGAPGARRPRAARLKVRVRYPSFERGITLITGTPAGLIVESPFLVYKSIDSIRIRTKEIFIRPVHHDVWNFPTSSTYRKLNNTSVNKSRSKWRKKHFFQQLFLFINIVPLKSDTISPTPF